MTARRAAAPAWRYDFRSTYRERPMSKRDVTLISVGLTHVGVCVPESYTREQVEAEVNAELAADLLEEFKGDIPPEHWHLSSYTPTPCDCGKPHRLHYRLIRPSSLNEEL